jgi:type II secretory ATPase GspE/PulE/Tfp pilus assembly ATPase PilB-like protein
MTAAMPIQQILLAEAAAPAWLMSAVKPALTFAALLAYLNLAAVKFLPDAQMFQSYGINPRKWSVAFLAAGIAGLAAAIAIPWWLAGMPLALAAFAAPCALYMKERSAKLADTKAPPILFFSIDFAKRAADKRAKAARASVALRFERKDRSEHPVPEKTDPAFPTYDGLQQLLGAAMQARAARIDLTLSKQGAQVQFLVDTVRLRRDPLAAEVATKTVDLLKTYAGLDPAERRKFQSGKVGVLGEHGRTIVTVSSFGSMQGEAIRVEFEREAQLTVAFDKAGFTEQQRKLLEEALRASPRGVVLVGARPGQGQTTLAYTLLSRHDALLSNIQTLERRVERIVVGVEHNTFDAGKSDYSTQLQSIVRRGPDVVLVTEPAESGIGKVICAPGAAGTLFYVAIPTDLPADMMAAWTKVAGSPAEAGERLVAVVSQRIVRRVCPSCKVPYAANPAEAKMLGAAAGKQLQLVKQSGKVLVKEQPVDCPTCQGTGFVGVIAVQEVLVLDDDARKLLAAGDVKGAYLQARRAHKSPSLQDAALLRVRAGDTSFDEVKRVFAPPAPSQAARPAASPAGAAAAAAPGKPGTAAKPGAPAAKPASAPKKA